MTDKAKRNYQLLKKWMHIRNDKKKITDHPLLQNKTIAIYGMGDLGSILLGEFTLYDVKVEYAVDQRWKLMFADFELYTTQQILPSVDVMIVTVISDYDVIYDVMKEKINCEFISLESIINDLYGMVVEQ